MMSEEVVKVFLPGESPWAEVVERRGDRIKARIINKLFNEYSEHERAQFMKREFGSAAALPITHNFKKGDEAWFEKSEEGVWVPILQSNIA